ncbi:MAG: substrate-binding domain-containing protein, partial [Bacteroidia bacterium]|nr:substrate-binding domain-containing protein [Bacteroidia bacterium]
MKKNLFPFLIAIAFLTFSCGEKQEKITVKGSDTVLPLTQKFAEVYAEKHGGSVTVIGGGSGVGISALETGTTNIAMASRSLKEGEKLKLQGMDKDFEELTIGFDALAMVVHPSNPVSQLTRE